MGSHLMETFVYYIIYGLAYVLSLLPFRILYFLSDGLYIVVYHLVGYRRRIVRKNISSSFPEKSETELQTIERAFYHWFCDYIFETIKLLSISHEKLLEHIEFRGVEQMEEAFDRGQNCAAILGHYCNWEWLSATGVAFRRFPQAVMGLIYHPLYNKAFDRLLINVRSSQGGVCIPKQDILRYLVSYKRERRNYLFGYISDQTPRMHNIHLWLTFLKQDTPVFTGGERIMKKMDDAVFYVDMQRPRRGHYICTFKQVASHAATEADNAITIRFFEMLEATIRRQPAFYLWTHNRWKHTRADFDREYIMVNGKAILKYEETDKNLS